MDKFYTSHSERKNRFFEIGIAEANMTLVASGLAKEGKIPFIGSYGVFVTGRNWDQRCPCRYLGRSRWSYPSGFGRYHQSLLST